MGNFKPKDFLWNKYHETVEKKPRFSFEKNFKQLLNETTQKNQRIFL